MTRRKDDCARIFDAGEKNRKELQVLGKSLRRQAPRREHAAWEPPKNRPDPVDLLRAQDEPRNENYVPIRYGRMSESPFKFFRGSAAIMACDLASTMTTGVFVQACGDAHVQNFGMFASPERHIVFDINDFDETQPGPWEFDVKRLAASVVLDCRELKFGENHALEAAQNSVRGYRDVMRSLAKESSLDIHYAFVGEHNFLATDYSSKVIKDAQQQIKRARKRTRFQAFRKWCTTEDGHLRFVDDPPLMVRLTAEQTDRFHKMFNHYRSTLPNDRMHALKEYRFRDAARRIVGVGSVGLGAFVMLLEGRGDFDPLIIQIKEATSSVLAPFVGKSEFVRHGERVVAGQKLMQAASDPFLGWAPFDDKDYYLRQLRDMKLGGHNRSDPDVHKSDAGICGGTLARAHARSVDPALIAGYLGSSDNFVEAISEFAFAYADQAEKDHARLLQAIKSGDISAEHGI